MVQLIKYTADLYEIKLYCENDGILLDEGEMKQLASLIKEAGF